MNIKLLILVLCYYISSIIQSYIHSHVKNISFLLWKKIKILSFFYLLLLFITKLCKHTVFFIFFLFLVWSVYFIYFSLVLITRTISSFLCMFIYHFCIEDFYNKSYIFFYLKNDDFALFIKYVYIHFVFNFCLFWCDKNCVFKYHWSDNRKLSVYAR